MTTTASPLQSEHATWYLPAGIAAGVVAFALIIFLIGAFF